MKTPREILLDLHRSAEPDLDRLWNQKLAPALANDSTLVHRNALVAAGWKMWRELIVPNRRIWAGLACAWVVIGALNLVSSERAVAVASQNRPPSHEEMRALVEQRRMLAQLIGPAPESASPRKHTMPGPHSENAPRVSAA